MTSSQTEFTQLNETEQRAVAERLLRIEESGWKPFWCARATCDGMPHWATDANDDPLFMSETDLSGPNGEALGEMVWETPGGDWVFASDGEHGTEDDTPVGRPILDPRWSHNHARTDQRLPAWTKPWVLFIMSGRGTGKTRTGVEFVTLCARKGLDGAIVGRRGTELVNTHVATIIEHAHPEFVPIHWASKDILEWPNGAITYLFSAEKPENIRSVNLSYAWVDEAAFMDDIETAWMNLRLAARKKVPNNPIHILVTSTPTPTKWVMKMEDDPDVEVRRVSTFANKANLDPDYLSMLVKEYRGTRKGRQELEGEVLRDVEGALWNDDLFRHHKIESGADFVSYLDSLDDRVIGVDPAGSANKRSDITGIIGAGARHTDENGNRLPASTFDVLCDASIKGSPTEWARQVYKAARLIKATRIVAEKNFGGDMVKQVLTDYADLHPSEARDSEGDPFRITVVHASQSKETRAESAVGRYEQGRVTHVPNPTEFGDLAELEKEQVGWVPKSRGGRMPSPNRIDALVWVIRELDNSIKHEAKSANSHDVFKQMTGSLSSRLRSPMASTAPLTENRAPLVVEAEPVWNPPAPRQFPAKERTKPVLPPISRRVPRKKVR